MTNEKIIENFFISFQKLDAKAMNNCYSSDIVFFDPMFKLLKGNEVSSMWEMLCSNAKNFSLTFDSIKNLDDGYYTCNWCATYIFSATGRTVKNNIKANMKIENGFIIEHSDAWSINKWAAQAYGLTGKLFGWTSFFRNKLRNGARKNLLQFMAS